MKGIEDHLKKMGKLRVDHNKNRYTLGKAPHKPILLLSLIVLNENHRIDLDNIIPTLVLRETWSELWECLEYSKPGPMHLPLYHMKSDGFWNVDMKDGIPPHQPRSIDNLYSMVDRISMKDDLIGFIEDESSRDRIISSILNGGYFSDLEKENLKKKIEELNGSFIYEHELVQKVKEEFTIEPRTSTEDLKKKRNPAFRRLVLGAYDETCAVCGMKLQTTSGISVIDASHILPFNKFGIDDIRNGLALCKMHHWLFDRGILSIDSHYRVLVSKSIENEHPENIISHFHRQDIILPEVGDYYPHPSAVEWHRSNVFEK